METETEDIQELKNWEDLTCCGQPGPSDRMISLAKEIVKIFGDIYIPRISYYDEILQFSFKSGAIFTLIDVNDEFDIQLEDGRYGISLEFNNKESEITQIIRFIRKYLDLKK